jgi:hypothetical protein
MVNIAVLVGTTAFLPQVLFHAGWLGESPAVDPALMSKLLRGAAVALLLACSLPIDLSRSRLPSILAAAGVCAAALMFLLRPPSPNALDVLFWNGAAVVVLSAALLASDIPAAGVGRAGLELSVLLQAALSLSLSVSGCWQSDNGGWVGATGNANTFAFLCLVVIGRHFFQPAVRWWHIPVIVVAALGVLESGSLFAVAWLAFLLCVGLIFRARIVVLSTVLLVAFLLLAALGDGLLGEELGAGAISHVAFKFRSLFAWILGDADVVASRSVGLRGLQWREAIDWFVQFPLALAVGGVGGGSYFAADSQVLTYVASFGVPVTMALLAPVALGIRRLGSAGPRFVEFGCQLLLVTVFLVVNRCYDYFSGGIVIALVLAEVSAPVPAGRRRMRSRP